MGARGALDRSCTRRSLLFLKLFCKIFFVFLGAGFVDTRVVGDSPFKPLYLSTPSCYHHQRLIDRSIDRLPANTHSPTPQYARQEARPMPFVHLHLLAQRVGFFWSAQDLCFVASANYHPESIRRRSGSSSALSICILAPPSRHMATTSVRLH